MTDDKQQQDEARRTALERNKRYGTDTPAADAPETERRPARGVKHEPEPDAGNIMPAEDEPGTL